LLTVLTINKTCFRRTIVCQIWCSMVWYGSVLSYWKLV